MGWIGWGEGPDIDGKGHVAFFFYIGRRGQAYQHYTGNTKGHRRHMWCWDLGEGVWWN